MFLMISLGENNPEVRTTGEEGWVGGSFPRQGLQTAYERASWTPGSGLGAQRRGRGGGPHLEGGFSDSSVKRWRVWGTLLPPEGGSRVWRGNGVRFGIRREDSVGTDCENAKQPAEPMSWAPSGVEHGRAMSLKDSQESGGWDGGLGPLRAAAVPGTSGPGALLAQVGRLAAGGVSRPCFFSRSLTAS